LYKTLVCKIIRKCNFVCVCVCVCIFARAAREPAYNNCCGPFQKRAATLALMTLALLPPDKSVMSSYWYCQRKVTISIHECPKRDNGHFVTKIRPLSTYTAGKEQCRTETGTNRSSPFQKIANESWDKEIEFYENVSVGMTTVSSSAVVQ
jgi:hypothetical protein